MRAHPSVRRRRSTIVDGSADSGGAQIRPFPFARAFGGGPLRGDKIMLLVYLDEAGIANREHEPHLVVAGVIVNADRQWRRLDDYFQRLAMHTFEDGDPSRFVFHAKDIWHGSGVFDRREWPLQERMKLLYQLAQVPRLFGLTVVVGVIDRNAAVDEIRKTNPTASEKGVRNMCHSMAFLEAVQRVESWMARRAPKEVAMLVAEDNPEMRVQTKRFHEGYTRPEEQGGEGFRARHIVDGVMFASKQDSVLLQIADHCAFIVRRKLMRKPHADRLYDALRPAIHWHLKPAQYFALFMKPSELGVA